MNKKVLANFFSKAKIKGIERDRYDRERERERERKQRQIRNRQL